MITRLFGPPRLVVRTSLAMFAVVAIVLTALDARDPYTAGHSERVSAISVTIGRQMGLSVGVSLRLDR